MRKLILVILTALLAIVPAMSGMPVTVAAEPSIEDLQKEIQRYNRQLQDLQKKRDEFLNRIKKIRKDEQVIWAEKIRLEKDIEVTKGRLEQARDRLTEAERRLDLTKEALARAEKDLERRTDLMNRRLKAIYENGSVTYLDVLLSANSFSDFLNRFELLQTILAGDIRLFQEVKALRAQLAELKVQREAERAKALSAKVQVEQVKLELEEKKSEKEELHRELKSKEAEYLKAMDELEATSRRVEAMLRRAEEELEKQLDKQGAVILSRPVNGPVTSPFGNRFHPIIRQWRLHTGVDYGVPMGTPVKAAEDGIVMHAGWLGGYGQAVILVHGKKVSTLYAHLSEINVQVNQRVAKGQVIGLVGSTGFSTGPHLHWEVRIDGTPQDPAGYIGRPVDAGR